MGSTFDAGRTAGPSSGRSAMLGFPRVLVSRLMISRPLVSRLLVSRLLVSKLLILGLLVLGPVACDQQPATASSPQEESHKEAVRILFEEVWNTGDVSPLRPWEADSVSIHYRGQTSRVNLDGLGDLVGHWRSAFPDLRMHLLHLVADGDLVAAYVRYEGTHQGTWFGIPATHERVDVDEMMFFRFEDGRLVEGWEVDDQLTMRTQLGILP